MPRRATRRTATARNLRFEHRLVLANWMLDLFGASTFADMGKHIKEPELEGFTEDGITKYHQNLKLVFNRPELPNDLLLAYDQNIVRHWREITEKRNADGRNLYPKYFQYLCLLFTEIYLDRFFRDPDKLLRDLNEYAKAFNAGTTHQQKALGQLFATGLPADAQIKPYTVQELRKLAFGAPPAAAKPS